MTDHIQNFLIRSIDVCISNGAVFTFFRNRFILYRSEWEPFGSSLLFPPPSVNNRNVRRLYEFIHLIYLHRSSAHSNACSCGWKHLIERDTLRFDKSTTVRRKTMRTFKYIPRSNPSPIQCFFIRSTQCANNVSPHDNTLVILRILNTVEHNPVCLYYETLYCILYFCTPFRTEPSKQFFKSLNHKTNLPLRHRFFL